MSDELSDKYYIHGHFFESLEEMVKFSQNWMASEIDEDTFYEIMQRFKKQCWVNYKLGYAPITNQEMMEIVDEAFMKFLETLIEKKGKSNLTEYQ